jgi:hypothetical protein
MTKLNSLAGARVIGPEGGAEDGAYGAGVGEGAAGVDVLVVSSSDCIVVAVLTQTVCCRMTLRSLFPTQLPLLDL